MSQLTPCPSCSRHLKRTEAACPFCGANVQTAMTSARDRAMPAGRLSRAALAAFAAASVNATACSSDSVNEPGRSPVETGDGSASGGEAGSGSGGALAVPAYGAPVFSGGATGNGGKVGAGGAQLGTGGGFAALYGSPPQTIYGAPPAPKK